MRFRKLLGPRFRALVLVAALILALPAIPAQAVPCDSYRIDLSSLPRRQFQVTVAADDAWQQAYGDSAKATARQLIAEVNRILEPTGVGLVLADYVTWMNQDSAPSMSQMLKHLDATVPAQPRQFVIGLTGRQISSVDGIAHVGHVHLVARRHPGQQPSDALVIAHETGHLLGAKHHKCDHDYQCLMAPKGFGLPARWCEHHVLEMQLGAAHMLAE